MKVLTTFLLLTASAAIAGQANLSAELQPVEHRKLAPEFLNGLADIALTEMARSLIGQGHLLVSEGETSALSGVYPLLVTARLGRSGIILQPDQSDSVLFRTQFPRLRRADFPPGRGLFVARSGQPVTVQVAFT